MSKILHRFNCSRFGKKVGCQPIGLGLLPRTALCKRRIHYACRGYVRIPNTFHAIGNSFEFGNKLFFASYSREVDAKWSERDSQVDSMKRMSFAVKSSGF